MERKLAEVQRYRFFDETPYSQSSNLALILAHWLALLSWLLLLNARSLALVLKLEM